MRKFLFISCLALSLASCKTAMLYTTLDILRPAQVGFAADAQRMLIVNNSAVQPAVVGHTNRPLFKPAEAVAVSTDSVALFALSVLAEEMDATGFFESVDLQLEPVQPDRKFDEIIPLQYATVRQLCDSFDVDVILSLDHMQVRDELGEYYDEEWSLCLAALDVRMETLWSVHYPDEIATTAVHFKDSLFWESESYSLNDAVDNLPDRQDALIDAALWAGQNSAKRFIPYWEQSDRYFYDPDDARMKQGMDSVYVRNWAGAAALWQTVYDTADKVKLKAEAANNLAIAYEILGDYDQAYTYASQAFDLFASRAVSHTEALLRLANYMNELKRRKEEITILNEQLGQ